MASSSSTRFVSRLLSPSRLQSFSTKAAQTPLLKSASHSSSSRISRISRLPVELSTMLPLHSAIASARLTSSLSIDSQSWGLVPQGISMPL